MQRTNQEDSLKYHLKVYGCQYNEWDGARIDYMLQKIGLIPTGEADAELIFVLSCSVRQTAVDRILGKIKNWPDKKVIITGCVLEADHKKYLAKGVNVWNWQKPKELLEILPDLEKQYSDGTIERFITEGNSNSAYLPIMVGCNNFCAYCAVPYTRGRETSRPMEDVVKDFKKLVQKGYKEILLLGQNVNSYKANQKSRRGDQGKSKNDFAILLKTLNDIPGDFTISFTSNHPKDMTNDVIEAIASLPKVKKQIHLPLQSGSNKILKAMNRPYTKEQYLELVDKIKKIIPEIKITTDVIVGFPGETEEDFQETVDVFKKVNYFQSFTNKYSPRIGTSAYKLGDPIPWDEKQRRWHILDQIANKR